MPSWLLLSSTANALGRAVAPREALQGQLIIQQASPWHRQDGAGRIITPDLCSLSHGCCWLKVRAHRRHRLVGKKCRCIMQRSGHDSLPLPLKI
jgi:hypothetical protein